MTSDPTFSYARPAGLEEARAQLAVPGTVPLGGGTDLLVALDEGVVHAGRLVDLRATPGLDVLEWRADGSLWIGAAVRIARLAGDPLVAERLPALSQAAESVGTVALRNMGTLGGNLCQRPRCWYWRRGIPCFKSGGSDCPAAAGENQYHAILGGGPCFIVHPSDPAVALTALEATVHVTGPRGPRAVPIGEFFVLPRQRLDAESVLEAGEFVEGVEVPERSMGGRQRYEKVMQRGAWDFALVSLAAVRRRDGAVRLVLGGVAPVPWAVNPSVEEDVASGGLGEEDYEFLAQRALHDATPLSGNGYKVRLAERLLMDAMRGTLQ